MSFQEDIQEALQVIKLKIKCLKKLDLQKKKEAICVDEQMIQDIVEN